MDEVLPAGAEVRRGTRTFRAPRFPWAAEGALWVAAGLMVAAVLLPMVYLVLRTAGAGSAAWDVLLRLATLETIGRTLGLAAAVTLASAILAVPLAWLTVRTDLPLRGLWSVLTALPLVIPSFVGGFLVIAALGPRGMLQQLLERTLGVERLPEIYGFPGALLTLTLLSYPYLLLTARAALQGMDPALEETSRSLGYGPWVTFRRVTLPQLRPALLSGGLLVALYTLRDFGAVSLLRYDTFTRVIYIQYRSFFDRSLAAAMALVLVALTLAILALELRSRGQGRYHRSTSGAARPARLVGLGRWRWPSLLFCGAVAALALLLPMGVLVYWVVRAGEPPRLLWGAAGNSIFVSALAAAVTTLAALPVAFLAVRRPGRLSQLVERFTYAGFALPGLVIALGLVFFSVNYARPLYQTLPVLILAYMVLFLPQAVGASKASLLQIRPSLEEAARSLGYGPLAALRSVTLPLVRPGLAAGAGLVFLTAMKELQATLLLAPTGYKTLATAVWSAAEDAFFARAAQPALLLVLVSALPVYFLTRMEAWSRWRS